MENLSEIQSESSQSFNIKDFIWLCISKWYIFVIALVITCGYAFFYLAKTPRHYVATAAMLFKDDTSSKTGDISQVFGDIEGFNTNANLSNEMVAIKSPVIMKECVERVGLDVDYNVNDGLRQRSLFGTDLPFTIKFLDLGENGKASLKMELKGDGFVTLKDFSEIVDGNSVSKSDQPMKINVASIGGDTLKSPLGRIILRPNETFAGNPAKTKDYIYVDRIGVAAATSRGLGGIATDFESKYSSVIHVSINDVNSQRAAATLQGVIDIYGEQWMADRNQISIATSNFINERLAVIENELGDVDTDISSYKSAHQLPDVAAASQAYFNRALSADQTTTELSNTLALARQVRNHLSNIANSFNVLPASSGLNNVGIEGLIGQYNTKLIERNALVANSSTENPVIIDMDNTLAAMRQSMLTAIDSYINTLNAQISASRAMQSTSSAMLAANPNQAKYLLSVERQQKVKESLYLYLLQKREENELSQAFTAYNSRVVAPPTAYGPVSPIPSKIYLMALAIGLLAPALLIFTVEKVNSKVRGRRDIEKLTIPFIGEIPQSGKRVSTLERVLLKRKAKKSPSQILVRHGSGNVINEAFRVIRTNLEFMVPPAEGSARVLMMTSANPGSGKTFITLNLAAVLALKNKRIAILDLDLRKASLSRSLNAPEIGLTNYLAGHATEDRIVVKDINGIENLDLYPVGPIPPNPTELLYSSRLKELVEKLRKEYDYILVDCPPVEVVADAKIINSMVDLTIFIIRSGLLEREMLPEIQQFYDSKRYQSMALILNGTPDPSNSAIRHANRFGYGYGYGYGYPRHKD
jgi:capsular exopolysaccharide synthesis family protein